MSFTPISLEKNPLAVKSRMLLKNCTPARISGFALAGLPAALGIRTVREVLVIRVVCESVEPAKAVANPRLVARILRADEVHELRHAGIRRTPRPLGLRADQLH